MSRPSSVKVIAVLTLLSSLAIGFFSLVSFLVYFVGGEGLAQSGGGGIYAAYAFLSVLPTLLMALYAFCLSICMLTSKSRYVWYASLIFWIFLCVLFTPLATSTWMSYSTGEYAGLKNLASWQIESLIAVLLPYFYAIGCALWFITSRKIHEYYGLNLNI